MKKILISILVGSLLFSNISMINASPITVAEEIIEYNLDTLEIPESPQSRSLISATAKLIIKGGKYVIQVGSKIYRAVSSSVAKNSLKSFKTSTYLTGNSKFLLTKSDMEHMLVRHHPKYWTGGVKAKQTFFSPNLSINDINNIALQVAKQNRSILQLRGTNGIYQVTGKVNGVSYTLGISKGHIKQLYPNK